MDNFPSNSRMPRSTPPVPVTSTPADVPKPEPETTEKRAEKVVTGEVIRKKPGLGKRFMETFFSGEAPKSVIRHVGLNVLLPSGKDVLRDAVMEGLDRLLWPSGRSGSSSRTSTTIRNGINSVVSYNRMSQTNNQQSRPTVSNYARTTQNFDELIFPSRMEAETVIEHMYVLLEKYPAVTVGDFFDLAGITNIEYTDRKFGWRSLQGVQVVRSGGGYIVHFPDKPELLK